MIKRVGKKLPLFLVAIMMISLIAGCGSQVSTKTSSMTTSGPSTAPQKKDQYVVGFAHTGPENDWTNEMAKDMQATWGSDSKFKFIYSDGQNKQENQIKALRAFIQQKVDAIILRPIITTGWDAVMKEIKDAGIPLITVNRKVIMASGSADDYMLSFIGPDNIHAGELEAQMMVDLFKDAQGSVNVAILEGTVGAASSLERTQGINNILSKQDKLVVKYRQAADYTRAKGKEVFESFLKSAQADSTKIDALISECDDMALGASQAMEEAGLKPGVDIKITGIDGIKGGFEAMVAGKYNGTIENPQGYGAASLKLLTDYLINGVTPGKWVKLDNRTFTQNQAAAELPNRKW
jgi:ABC-type sugar transport system substrate-binding protein